jgi:hypothetical protein
VGIRQPEKFKRTTLWWVPNNTKKTQSGEPFPDSLKIKKERRGPVVVWGKQDSEFEQELLTARGRVFRYRKLREEKEIRWQGRQGCDREIFVVDRGVFVVDDGGHAPGHERGAREPQGG